VDATTGHGAAGVADGDLARRIATLSDRLVDGLKPLAEVAYNYRWSWLPDGEAVFRDISAHRWELSGQNPVRFLTDLWPATQQAVERDERLMARVAALAASVAADLERPPRPRPGVPGPVAFFCAEFGFHASMPIYSGGLGVLAGDILKEASDQALPLIGVGLFYGRGYFRQRLDLSGRQQEYWLGNDPHGLPMSRVTKPDGSALRLTVPLLGAPLAFQAWRVDVGRVPLFLLDSELPENDPVQRWTTARLYDGNRAVRLAQYGLLGIGGIRLLRALGIEPAVVHMNEGHPALAALELAAEQVELGASLEDGLAAARERVVFTTHTPVAAGNETYPGDEFGAAYAELAGRLGIDTRRLLSLCRVDPADEGEQPGMTPLAIRMSRRRNGVSRLHGHVARGIWQPMFPNTDPVDVPIGHVTNGAHVATFTAEPIRTLLARYLGDGWLDEAHSPTAWERVWSIPNDELWAARCVARSELIHYIRQKSQQDRLLRGEQIEYVRAVTDCLDPDTLTLGFARRLATYKRLHLLVRDPARLERIVAGPTPVQLLISGKAHPRDEAGKDTLERVYHLKRDTDATERIVFVENYALDVARRLVAGCDVWVNLPRKPMEASGTSGMKATFNGVLQLSVLDGWWAEAYNGTNGWAIPGEEDADEEAADARDAERLYSLLENEIVPAFYERDENGVPGRWCERIKEALVTCAPRFSAGRMLDDYVEQVYAGVAPRVGADREARAGVA
jgi:starch phosphorylase